ncbi:hypothetical protein EXIGLDRAFT_834172 [Exidia glandulosa HHB12029]|uniref:UBC core domain-containing protein n=1 Tax=Exidia glandulosa HHB12029 TaxID=1314781 RepID=A0A165K2D3_EXIGL|nr:hypothetical protein EXIGLDRAFT_834172 [Exidia glandulosa HHB12029]
MTARLRRVTREIAECGKDTAANISIDLVDESPFHVIGAFDGPEGTPYEGGRFLVNVVVPPQYPFQPFKIKFITFVLAPSYYPSVLIVRRKVYHPNVSSRSSAICLNILKDDWSPVLTLRSTLISLQSMLSSPEPNDPQDPEVATHYLTSRDSFNDTARYWTQLYARGSESPASNDTGGTRSVADAAAMAGIERVHVERFVDMGFDGVKVVEVLRRFNYRGANVEKLHDDRIVEELRK